MRRGKIVFITGGARSGKSDFAERIAQQKGEKVVYIATSIPCDDEMKQRITKHRARRPQHWKTFEAFKDIDEIIQQVGSDVDVILLDCVTVMVTNLLLQTGIDFEKCSLEMIDEIESEIKGEIGKILKAAEKVNAYTIIVSNEVGMGIVPEYRLSRIFRDIAGRINQMIARKADDVYLVVSGIPMRLKKNGRKVL